MLKGETKVVSWKLQNNPFLKLETVFWDNPRPKEDLTIEGQNQARVNPSGLLIKPRPTTCVVKVKESLCKEIEPIFYLRKKPLNRFQRAKDKGLCSTPS
jgi:hypothetical protein